MELGQCKAPPEIVKVILRNVTMLFLLTLSASSWGWNCESNCGRLGWFEGKYECKAWKIANCSRDQKPLKKWFQVACGTAGAVGCGYVTGGAAAVTCAGLAAGACVSSE